MYNFEVDQMFVGADGEATEGKVFFTVSPAETTDVEGKLIPYTEMVNLSMRIMELLDLHQVDLFNDIDHEHQFDQRPTIDELKSAYPLRGQGVFGNYIIIHAAVEVRDHVPIFRIGLKMTDERALAAVKLMRGVSFSAFSRFEEHGNG